MGQILLHEEKKHLQQQPQKQIEDQEEKRRHQNLKIQQQPQKEIEVHKEKKQLQEIKIQFQNQIEDQIYIDPIREQEGALKLQGYVPKNKKGEIIGKSGVTISTGFDIGQHNKADLDKMELPQSLVDKYSHYLLLKKQHAVQKLKERPLIITQEQAEVTEVAVLYKNIKDFRRIFKDQLPQLTKGQKTAIYSVGYQYGWGSKHIAQIKQLLQQPDGIKQAEVYFNQQANNVNQKFKKRWNQNLDLFQNKPVQIQKQSTQKQQDKPLQMQKQSPQNQQNKPVQMQKQSAQQQQNIQVQFQNQPQNKTVENGNDSAQQQQNKSVENDNESTQQQQNTLVDNGNKSQQLMLRLILLQRLLLRRVLMPSRCPRCGQSHILKEDDYSQQIQQIEQQQQ